MSLLTLHIATKGFLAGTTLAIAASGFLQPDVVAPEVTPFGGSQQRYVEYVEPRKPRIIHALDFALSAKAELVFAATSKHESESKTPIEVEYSSLSLLGYNASSEVSGKNVRVTELTSTANLALDVKSEVYTYSAASAEVAYNSTSVLAFNITSGIAAHTEDRNSYTYQSKQELGIAMTSTISTFSATPKQDNEIEEVLAIAINYLYG